MHKSQTDPLTKNPWSILVLAEDLDLGRLLVQEQEQQQRQQCTADPMQVHSRLSFLLQPRGLESGGHVAALALTAVLAQMHIVLGMTRRAVLGRLCHVRGLLMAAFAGGLGMRAGQREFRGLAVIELPQVPAVR